MAKSKGLVISRETLLYIAGPCTPTPLNPDQRSNENKAMLCGLKWFKRGYSVYIPHMNTRGFDCFGVKYEEFMDSCFAIIRRCDGMVMMDNWHESRGATREYTFACSLHLPVFLDEYFDRYMAEDK